MIAFGVLKDWLGCHAGSVELPEGASVAGLLECLRSKLPPHAAEHGFRGIAVSVNAEYAQASRILHDGDEVGLLPPVSGGTEPFAGHSDPIKNATDVVAYLTCERIRTDTIVADAKSGEDGAVVVFDGIVRNHTRGRKTLHLDYEAYEEMAAKQMGELGRKARERFGVHRVVLVHRLGRLIIGETSVLIVVSSAHRSAAFGACRWLIDTLKQSVPIWKKETFTDGAVWAPGEPFPENLAIDVAEAAREG